MDRCRKVVSESQEVFIKEHGTRGILNDDGREESNQALSMALQNKRASFNGRRVSFDMFYAAVGSIETMKALGIVFWRPDVRQEMIAAVRML